MTRQIPSDKPLSDKDRAYLLMRGQEGRVEWFDQTYPADVSEEAEGEADEYDSWKVDELKAENDRRNEEDDAEIVPSGTRKADLIAALREHDAATEGVDEEEDEEK